MGVGAISGAVQYHRMAIQLLGGVVLFAFGLKLYFAAPRFVPVIPVADRAETLRDFVWDIPQTFLLTITNPGAVLGLFAIFGGVSTFVEVKSYVDALTIVAAVMGGSLAWWVGLSHLIARFRHRLSLARLQLINQVAGLLLLAFGVLLVGEVVMKRLGFL
jgi:arginine exporter protein ArgO